ncbi:MAG: hypothetical protein HY830_04695 [Actinobacteria bacterium]|nr:hypothetical protein [Actinomycetota bacterium]
MAAALSDSELLDLLDEIDFSARYYTFCDRDRALASDPGLTRADHAAALSASGLEFGYRSREKFFRHREHTARGQVTFNLAFGRSSLEGILTVAVGDDVLGGPFHSMAAELATRKDSGFTREPAYPRMPFHDRESLSQAVTFAAGLYGELVKLLGVR